MKITGETLIAAPQEAVWRALNDPEILRRSIPGCETLEQTADNAFKATVASRIGPISARFNGNVRLSDLDPPNSYTLTGEGSGGPAGAAKGVAKVRLEPAPGGTRLIYDVDAQISGKLAQIGARVVDAAARMLAGQFFDRQAQADSGETPAPKVAASQAVPTWVWVAGAVVVIAALSIIWLAV
jgi:carbon monoxide dehydrogenase subunit G